MLLLKHSCFHSLIYSLKKYSIRIEIAKSMKDIKYTVIKAMAIMELSFCSEKFRGWLKFCSENAKITLDIDRLRKCLVHIKQEIESTFEISNAPRCSIEIFAERSKREIFAKGFLANWSTGEISKPMKKFENGTYKIRAFFGPNYFCNAHRCMISSFVALKWQRFIFSSRSDPLLFEQCKCYIKVSILRIFKKSFLYATLSLD